MAVPSHGVKGGDNNWGEGRGLQRNSNAVSGSGYGSPCDSVIPNRTGRRRFPANEMAVIRSPHRPLAPSSRGIARDARGRPSGPIQWRRAGFGSQGDPDSFWGGRKHCLPQRAGHLQGTRRDTITYPLITCHVRVLDPSESWIYASDSEVTRIMVTMMTTVLVSEFKGQVSEKSELDGYHSRSRVSAI